MTFINILLLRIIDEGKMIIAIVKQIASRIFVRHVIS